MGSKSSSPMSPASVSKRRRVMEEPSMLLQDENAGETRRRSLRNRGEIRKPVIETDEDEYLLSDEDDAHDNLDVDDDNDYVQDIDAYYPETEDVDSEPQMMNYSISGVKDGSVESLVASWKLCITGVGQGFESVVEFRDALQKYAVACRFGYRLRKNESNRACGVCLVGGCPWKIYASWVPSESMFRIKKFNRRHTCGGESWKSAHPKKNWVVSIIKERLQENPNQKTKNIADSIFQDFGIELSYCTIRRGIDEAKGGLHTSFKDAYKHLPLFVNKVVETNPGSIVDLVVGEDKRFQRLFLSFRSCINGFLTGCRPLLFLDAIPFKSRYHEILLTASALDGDDGVLPVALALVDVETDETWRWFLEQVKVAVPSLRPLTFVSDREKGLVSSVLEIFENAHHGYSIHYLMEDFMRSLRGPFLGDGKPSLSYYLLAAARADRLDGFKVYTEQIKRVSPKAYDWVMEIEGKHWANALFEGEPYSHITSDVGEIYSKWIEEIQETSIVLKLVVFVSRIVELGEVTPFKNYLERYTTPYLASKSSNPLWYSVRRASAHIIVLSSYSPFVKYTPQWRWLDEEFKRVDREKTPWLIVLMHSPIYNSNEAHFKEGESMRAAFEEWFVEYRVDVVFAGHVHAYERSYRVSNVRYNVSSGDRFPVPDTSAPVYITVGDGGNQEGLAGRFMEPQPDYSAFREASYGHSTLDIKNRTHAIYHWNRNDDGKKVATDEFVLYNQYWGKNIRRRKLKKHYIKSVVVEWIAS
ncbi:hypothetical protein F2Q68_00039688 [Brassica cretica]|uniref:acid phosphatase n=1 Tax=Brassica cretica TaxID=69181 RepID=A0A8S9MDW2_BRACR|nr:hypothetical protein F2Q68_00039688 [Brassica cretica]